MRLYELNFEMNEIAERLEAALEWEPDTDTLGRPIDFDGNVIDDVEKFRCDMIEAWKTTLDGVAEEFDEKAANIAVYIKDLKSESEQLYKEEKALKKRRAVKENALKTVTKYLFESMQEVGKSKIGTAKAEISLRTNPESVEIADENGFVKWAQENRRTETICSDTQSLKSTNLPSKRLSRAEKIFPAWKSSARSRL